jgi:hypothetical protein
VWATLAKRAPQECPVARRTLGRVARIRAGGIALVPIKCRVRSRLRTQLHGPSAKRGDEHNERAPSTQRRALVDALSAKRVRRDALARSVVACGRAMRSNV